MNNDIKVSIIFPAYNVEKYIAKAIESVLSQTYKNFELIIVNDGSTDSTVIISEQYAAKDNRIKIVNKINAGAGMARKTGLINAYGEYIFFMDPDDYIDINCLSDILNKVNEDIDVVTFGHYDVTVSNTNSDNILGKVSVLPRLNGEYNYESFINNFYDYLQSCCWLMWGHFYRREYLLNAGDIFSSQKTGEDALFHLNLFKKPFRKMLFIDKPYYYQVKKNNSTITSYHPERFDCELNVARKLTDFLNEKNLKSQKYKDWKCYIYLNAVMLEIKNVALSTCSLNSKQKIKRIKNIVKIKDVAEAIKIIKIKKNMSLKEQVKISLIKLRQYSLLIKLMK